MSVFSEAMANNPPRLVVLFQHGDDGSERFQWGVVGNIPILSLVGAITHVQANIVAGNWIPECDHEQTALVVIWDAEDRTVSHYLSSEIPALPLVGMLETIKAMIVASRMGQQVGSQKVERSLLGPDGTPMRY